MAEPTEGVNETKAPTVLRGQAAAAFPLAASLEKHSGTPPSAATSASSLAFLASQSNSDGSDTDDDAASLLARLEAVQQIESQLLEPPIVPNVGRRAAAGVSSPSNSSSEDNQEMSSAPASGAGDLLSVLASAAGVAPPVGAGKPASSSSPAVPKLGDASAVLGEVPSTSESKAAAASSGSQPDAATVGGFEFYGEKATLFENDQLGFTFRAYNRVRSADWERDVKDKNCFVTCSGPGTSTVEGFVCACGIKVYSSKKSTLLPFLLLYNDGNFTWCQAGRVQSVEEREQAVGERQKMLLAFVEWEKSQVSPKKADGPAAASADTEDAESPATAGTSRRRNPPRGSTMRGGAAQHGEVSKASASSRKAPKPRTSRRSSAKEAKSMSMELEAESEVPASENDYGASQTRSGAGFRRRSGVLQSLPLPQLSATPSAEQESKPHDKLSLLSTSPQPAASSKQQQPEQQQQHPRGVKRSQAPAATSQEDLPPPSPPKKVKKASAPAEHPAATAANTRADSQPVTMGDLKALLAQLVPAQPIASVAPATAAGLSLGGTVPVSPASAAPAAMAASPQAAFVAAHQFNDNGWLAVKAQADSLWFRDQMVALKLERDSLLLQQAYQAGQRSRF